MIWGHKIERYDMYMQSEKQKEHKILIKNHKNYCKELLIGSLDKAHIEGSILIFFNGF